MPDYVGTMNNSKNLSGLRQQRFVFHSTARPLKVICATSISMSTKEFPSPCFHD